MTRIVSLRILLHISQGFLQRLDLVTELRCQLEVQLRCRLVHAAGQMVDLLLQLLLVQGIRILAMTLRLAGFRIYVFKGMPGQCGNL